MEMLDFGSQSINIPYILGTKYIFSLKNQTAINFNGSKIELSSKPWECDYNIHLFCLNEAGTLKQGAAVKIYRFKLYNGNEIIRDFIPCLDDKSEPCMYDLIEKKSYYNVGNKQFAYPKDNDFSTPSLPEGFKKCAYLQSDGTQWIDTEYIPDSNTGLLVIAQRLNYGDYINFGSRTNASSYIYVPTYNTVSKHMIYAWNTYKAPYTYDTGDDLQYISSINIYNDKKAKIDSYDTDYEIYLTSPLNEHLYSLWLFSYNYQGSFNETYGKWGGRIHRAQITQENELVRDYIPCLDADGKPCMYDIISGVAYYNQGSGKDFEFCIEHKLPHDFSKLKWLESEGTQYIKTNYIPSNNTGLYIDTYHTGKKAEYGMPFAMRDTSSGNYVAVHRLMKSTGLTGYGWGGWINAGSMGDCRYEASLNWMNDKKAICSAPIFNQINNSLGDLTFTPSRDLMLFGLHDYNGNYVPYCFKIYRAKISEGDQIVRDYVPAFDTVKQRPCMYDLINNVAYYNDGEGEFLYNNDFEGTYKGYTGLSVIGNKLSGNCYHLVNALITDGNCRINLGKGIIDSDISHDFRGYTTNSSRFMFGTSTFGADYFWQGDGILVWGGTICSVVSNSDVIVVVDNKNNKVRYNNTIITKNANFTSNKQTSIFDVGRDDIEKEYRPAANGSKFYKWVMKKDNEIIHDYRPAVDNNSTPCVLDTVTGEAFYNSLSGVLSWE